eukprot:2522571-Amphidinium_carterae.1
MQENGNAVKRTSNSLATSGGAAHTSRHSSACRQPGRSGRPILWELVGNLLHHAAIIVAHLGVCKGVTSLLKNALACAA